MTPAKDDAETLLLRPSKRKYIVLLIGSLAFTVGGGFMIAADKPMAWLCTIVFGLCSAIAVGILLPNSAYLRLSPDGYECRSLFRSSQQRWADVAAFHPGRIGLNAMVLIEFAPTYSKHRKGRALAAALTGTEGALPDTYGRSATDLAKLLNDWRARAAQRAQQTQQTQQTQ